MINLLYQEIDLKRMAENFEAIKRKSKKDIIAVVKSRCYGLGDRQIPKYLEALGCRILAVVDMFEASRLLEEGIRTGILVLNSVDYDTYAYVNEFPNLILSVNSLQDARQLADCRFDRTVKLHIQIDTGMNRLGFTNMTNYLEALDILQTNPNLRIEGIYTHFSSPENRVLQENRFLPYLDAYPYLMIHCAASSTYEHSAIGNFVRVGLDLYGDGRKDFLKQIVKIGCHPLTVNRVPAGETIGYDQEYLAQEDVIVAVLPIGYSNGFRRSLGGFPVMGNNQKYPTIGKVCMNHLYVLADESVNVNTEFIITSADFPIREMADYLKTTPHEIYCMMNIDNKIYLK